MRNPCKNFREKGGCWFWRNILKKRIFRFFSANIPKNVQKQIFKGTEIIKKKYVVVFKIWAKKKSGPTIPSHHIPSPVNKRGENAWEPGGDILVSLNFIMIPCMSPPGSQAFCAPLYWLSLWYLFKNNRQHGKTINREHPSVHPSVNTSWKKFPKYLQVLPVRARLATAHARLVTSDFPIFLFSEFPNFRFSNFPKYRISDFPIFWISNFPNFRFYDFPNFLISNFPFFQLSDFPYSRISDFQYLRFSEFPIFRCPIFRISDFSNFRSSDFPNFRFSNFPIFQIPEFTIINTSDFPIFRISDFPIFHFPIFRILKFLNFGMTDFTNSKQATKKIPSCFR